MQSLNKNQAIINDILRQGRLLLDGNKITKADLTTDIVFMMCDNEITSDKLYAATYYDNEDDILEVLLNYR